MSCGTFFFSLSSLHSRYAIFIIYRNIIFFFQIPLVSSWIRAASDCEAHHESNSDQSNGDLPPSHGLSNGGLETVKLLSIIIFYIIYKYGKMVKFSIQYSLIQCFTLQFKKRRIDGKKNKQGCLVLIRTLFLTKV